MSAAPKKKRGRPRKYPNVIKFAPPKAKADKGSTPPVSYRELIALVAAAEVDPANIDAAKGPIADEARRLGVKLRELLTLGLGLEHDSELSTWGEFIFALDIGADITNANFVRGLHNRLMDIQSKATTNARPPARVFDLASFRKVAARAKAVT